MEEPSQLLEGNSPHHSETPDLASVTTNPPFSLNLKNRFHSLLNNTSAPPLKSNSPVPVPSVSPNPNNQQTNHTTQGRTNEPRPPLLHFKNIQNFTNFIEIVKTSVGENNFSCRVKGDVLSIKVETSDQWRALSRVALDKGLEFFTHSLKEEKPFRVVVRGLHHQTHLDFIKSDLDSKGHKATSITPIRGKGNEPRSLFFIDLLPNSNNKDIYNIKTLCFCVIKVEEPHPPRSVVQCKRCQRPGHCKNWCNLPPRCVKCAGPHDTLNCPGPKRFPPGEAKCVLCSDKGHAASWRGCPVHQKINQRINPTYNQPSTTPPNYKTFKQATPSFSYAAAAASSNNIIPPEKPTPQPSTTPTPKNEHPHPNLPSSKEIIPHPSPSEQLTPPSTSQVPILPSTSQTHINLPTNQTTPSQPPHDLITSLSHLVLQIQQVISPLVSILSQLTTSLNILSSKA